MNTKILRAGSIVYNRRTRNIETVKATAEGAEYPDYAGINITVPFLKQHGFDFPLHVTRVKGEAVSDGSTVAHVMQRPLNPETDAPADSNVTFYLSSNKVQNVVIRIKGKKVLEAHAGYIHELQNLLWYVDIDL